MASGTKIVRRNFALKIGSSKEMRASLQKKQQQATSFAKSTSEMVKSYINGAYKSDSANNFWSELTQTKVSSSRKENKGPLRSMRSVLDRSQPAIIPVASPGGLTSLASDTKRNTIKPSTAQKLSDEDDDPIKARHTSAVASIAANRRLLRNSNGCFKIINYRRFGSSASSSCGSIFKRHDDRRRVSSFKRTVSGGFIERLYNTQPNNDVKNSLANISSSKYLLSLRNQNIAAPLGSVAEAVRVSSNIQQDLMPIDKAIRERISLKNTFIPKASSPEQPRDNDPMSGWHHPPTTSDTLTTSKSERLWYRRPQAHVTPTTTAMQQQQQQQQQQQHQSATTFSKPKVERSQSSIRSIERYSERRNNSTSKLTEKESKEDQRYRLVRKPARLTLTCTPPQPTEHTPLMSASTLATKRKISQPAHSALPITACPSNAISSDDESQPRKMIHMTARRINTVEHQPVRRFSLRRPPTTNLTQITPPAPGPAAESLTQHNRNNNSNAANSRSSPMSTYASTMNSTSNRYSHFNNRPY